jgi:hypothetical protein
MSSSGSCPGYLLIHQDTCKSNVIGKFIAGNLRGLPDSEVKTLDQNGSIEKWSLTKVLD